MREPELAAQSVDKKAGNSGPQAKGMMADSPVRFPKEGTLLAKYPPDAMGEAQITENGRPLFFASSNAGTMLEQPSELVESGYYLLNSPIRSLAQIRQIQSEMPKATFTPSTNGWKHLDRTRRILTHGGPLHIMAVGDSIVNDMMRSGWLALLREAYPKASIRGTVYVRASGGCQHFQDKRRVAKYILPRKPDLVIIGGISQQGMTCIQTVIGQIRAGLPEVEIILTTGAFGDVDPRATAELAAASWSGTGEYGVALRRLAEDQRCAYLDLTTPWAEYIRSSKLHPHYFYRDHIHANEYGEQVLGKIMLSFLADSEREAQKSQARASLP